MIGSLDELRGCNRTIKICRQQAAERKLVGVGAFVEEGG
jgi:hypothetical protein